MRIGQGWDLHRLVSGRVLRLAGVEIPHTWGLLGHSDGDVVLHAVCDALLGAAGEGDIGHHFPDSDPRYRDADSAELLRVVVALLSRRGFRVGNIDVTVMAEAPRLAPHIDSMRRRLAELLKVEGAAVNLKAKTMEGVDAVGRREAMAASAVVLLVETSTVRG